MIDPPDWGQIDVYREGDDGVLPTATGGEFGEIPDYGSLDNIGHNPFIFRVWQVTLATTVETTLVLDDRPDYWIVSQRTTDVNGITYIWPDRRASGAAIEIGPGGKARLPGISMSLTLRAAGTGSSVVNVLAVRGYAFGDVDWN